MDSYFDVFWIGRVIFQRALAAIYLTAFISALNQFPVLLGDKGFLPAAEFIRQVPFKSAPSLFYLGYSDRFFTVLAWLGILLSAGLILGLLEKLPWWISTLAWLTLWIFYLSIVNVGQTFFSFGWESMLVEAGFFAAFLASPRLASSLIPILILRWMLFRVELGAGLIKLRSDECWRNLTCLYYHYETQPLPNPLSWFFYQFPKWFQRFSVLFSHFVQVIAPFGLFAPKRIAAISGALIIFHQMLLIVSGNYSWLNWLTVVLGLTALGDSVWSIFFTLPETAVGRSFFYSGTVYMLAIVTVALSIQPTLNFFSRNQLMNYNYNPLHLVGSYGAFGSVTKERYEIIIEATEEKDLTLNTQWKEYEFKAKPGDVHRRPPQIAPYHLRLDWLMWFLPFSVRELPDGRLEHPYELWFLRFMLRLLQADTPTLKLLKSAPFGDKPPYYVRALFYRYQYTDARERKTTGAWWKRKLVGEYFPPVQLSQLERFK